MARPSTAAVRLLSGDREPVLVATTANITLSGLQTIDGIALAAGNRVLVKDQTDATANGIYEASAGTWYRAADARSPRAINKGVTVRVQSGTENNGRVYVFQTLDPDIGDDDILVSLYLADDFFADTRTRLTADTTYNVPGDYLTIQSAIDHAVRAVDSGGYSITIMVAAGFVDTGGATMTSPLHGGGQIVISGAGVGSGIRTTSANCVNASNGAHIVLTGLKLETLTGGDCISATKCAHVQLAGLEFGACVGSHISIGSYAVVEPYGNYTITAAATSHIHMPNGGQFVPQTITITVSGAFAWGAYFIGMRGGAYADFKSVTFAGTTPGPSIDGVIHIGSMLDMDNKDVDFLPSDLPLTIARGGVIVASPPSIAVGGSRTFGIATGLYWVNDGVGGTALISYRALAVPTAEIVWQNGAGTTFVTADPGAGANKWWVQPSGKFTNRFVGANTLSIAALTPGIV